MSAEISSMLIRGKAALSINKPVEPTPFGWAWVALNVIAQQETGHTPSRSHPEWWGGEVPWIGIRDARLHHGGTIYETLQTINPEGLANSSARLLPKGTVCLSRTASVGYVVRMGREMATSQDFVTWTCSLALLPEFLMKALMAEGEDIRKFGKGTTHTTIYFPEVRALHICLPPLGEQKRIVAKLDALNAKSTRARTELARIETLVSRYKQAVLSKAFSGELTREWRKFSLGEALRESQVGLVRSKEQQFSAGGIPYIRMNHFDLDGRWKLDEISHVEASYQEVCQFSLKTGDILFNTRNSFELVGKVALWEGSEETFLYNNNILRMRFDNTILPKFAYYQMRTAEFRKYLESVKSATTSVCAIYQKPLVKAQFIAPDTLPEQHEIVRRIESAFARIDRLATEAKRALELLGKLDEAILAKAFRGELVPQDPTDEPAHLLLERIRAERAAAPKAKRGRKR